MIRFGKILLLLVPLAVGSLWGVHPGRAQDAESPRFAFADTTLLRDTLGITFIRLFPLADSLGLLPDTLRALSIRYLFTPVRLVELADSLRVPVDSVGVVLERERFNPLARGAERVSKFAYNTTYDIQRSSNGWRNASDYSFGQGPLFVHNTATIQLDRYTSAGRLSRRQQRDSSTEGGWKLSPDFSVGGRADLSRFDSSDPSSISNIGETRNEFKLSVRTRQRPTRTMSSEVSFLSGLLDLDNSSLEKRGLTSDLSGRFRYESGRWLVNELTGQLTGNYARTRLPGDTVNVRLNTRDFSSNLRGTLSVFQQAPIGFNGAYSSRGIRIQTPAIGGVIRQLLTRSNAFDGTLRARQNNDRYLNLTEHFGTDDQASASGQNTTRDDESFSADGRYAWLGWILESRFSNTYSVSAVPSVTALGGYGERQHARSLNGAISRALTKRLTTRLTGEIGVTSYRYFAIGIYPSLPVTRDQYRQSYRMEVAYSPSERFNSGVTLDVSRNQLINIASANVAGNNETRSYRAEWRWTYRLLTGLTATQRNTVSANYNYLFLSQNNRLSLDYNAVTTLNAVLSPKLTINVTHNAQQTPSGNFIDEEGTLFFLRADESQTYLLDASIAYSPSPSLSLSVQPRYRASDRDVTVSGETAPQRESRNLTFSGRASLNIEVGQKGRLTGDIGRTFTSDRSTTFTAGLPNIGPATETDYWNGSLQFSWQL